MIAVSSFALCSPGKLCNFTVHTHTIRHVLNVAMEMHEVSATWI